MDVGEDLTVEAFGIVDQFDIDRQHHQLFAGGVEVGFERCEAETLDIFVGGEHPMIGRSAIEDSLHIRRSEDMMVGKSEHSGSGIERLNMMDEVLRLCDATNDQRLARQREGRIVQAREIQMLVGRQMELGIHHTHVDRRHRFRAFAHHYTIGIEGPMRQVAQTSPRQHMIVDIEPVVGREQYIESAADRTMLEGIVEHHHIEVRHLFLQRAEKTGTRNTGIVIIA